MNKKRCVCGVLSLAAVGSILYLTLQSQEQTVSLSDSVYEWLASFGIRIDRIRNIVHVPMYYVLGLVLTLYGKSSNWKTRSIFIVAFAVALSDEVIKIFLPTREFELIDLSLDFVGIILAFLTVEAVIRLVTYYNSNHMSHSG